jgi:cyclophilin family peptidyl-prolyl cis-trans isomerase/protein-disulfide isomerase
MLRTALLGCIFLSLAACGPQAEVQAEPTATATASAAPTAIIATATSAMGCSVIQAEPTPVASEPLAAVNANDYARGPESAPVTLLAYCDFQSATCQTYAGILDRLQINHPNDLRIVFRPVPAIKYIQQLDKTQISVQAALAAGDQGKFWEMRDRLEAKYTEWVHLSVSQFYVWAVTEATNIGLDGAKFKADMESARTTARAKSMYDNAAASNLSIPMAFINGNLQPSPAISYDGLDSTIGLIALGKREYKTCPPFNIDPSKSYSATLHTEKGDIVMQLYAAQAPLAVNSFVFLARQGWFNGVTFHRVIPGFVAQAGDPSGTGSGGPGYYFKNEVTTKLTFDKPGVVGMANAGPDTNGSQFFITYAPATKLDGSYTVFAQVTKGMDVAESLTARDPQTTPGLPPGDRILSVTIEEK